MLVLPCACPDCWWIKADAGAQPALRPETVARTLTQHAGGRFVTLTAEREGGAGAQVVVNPPHMRSMGRVYNTPDCRIAPSQTSVTNIWCADCHGFLHLSVVAAQLPPSSASCISPCFCFLTFASSLANPNTAVPLLPDRISSSHAPAEAQTCMHRLWHLGRRLKSLQARFKAAVAKRARACRACWDPFQDDEVNITGYAVQAFRYGNLSADASHDGQGEPLTGKVPVSLNATGYNFGNMSLKVRPAQQRSRT